MQTERQREAAEFRAQGSQKSQEIRARADRDVTVLLADATSQAETSPRRRRRRPATDLADAYNKDPDFFSFYRSMQAYEQGMQHPEYTYRAAAGFGFLPLFSAIRTAKRRRTRPLRPQRRRARRRHRLHRLRRRRAQR